MAFKRVVSPRSELVGEDLTSSMIGIGMNFAGAAGKPAPQPNIEDTLLFASIEGMLRDDLRVLSVLITWLGVHIPWVNVDRLTHLVLAHRDVRLRSFWAGIAGWQGADRRLRRIGRARPRERVDLLAAGTAFQVRRHGEDPRFEQGPLRVPANVLRDRAADVAPPAVLATKHDAYRWRVIIGPTYRSDMWAALSREPDLSAAELARRTYGSFATAWSVRRDHEIVAGTGSGLTPKPGHIGHPRGR